MTRRILNMTLATLVVAVFATPAGAQVARPRIQGPGQAGSYYQVAYDDGYRAGFTRGEDDARRGQQFNYQRHREYQRANAGYSGSTNRAQHADTFRQGFAVGYREGYERSGRYGRYPDSRYPNSRYPTYPGNYPNQGGYYPGRGGYGYNSPAFTNGFNDGYKEGEKDGRKNDRFDPIGENRYRKGDHGYRREYGSKEQYKNAYRDAFRAGYEQGFRDTRGGNWNRGRPW
jgi:hypothetical protein